MTNEEYLIAGWDALTPLEQRRVKAIMPVSFQKLLQAQIEGEIADFREIRDGVYQVQILDSDFWQSVTASSLENFFAQLRC